MIRKEVCKDDMILKITPSTEFDMSCLIGSVYTKKIV